MSEADPSGRFLGAGLSAGWTGESRAFARRSPVTGAESIRGRTMLKHIAALTLVLAFLFGPVQAERYKGFPRGHALITASELKSMLDGPGPRPVVLAAVGKLSWLAGRIPGASHAPRHSYTDRDGMALGRKQFQRFARRHGIDDDSRVVVYDERYDAARLWWLFFLYGKTDVRLLDGGMAAWRAAGHSVDRGFGRSPPGGGRFVASPARDGWVADIEDVAEAASDGSPIWDTRDLPEWKGASIGGLPSGRIDRARFIGWKVFRRTEKGRPSEFRSAAETSAVLEAAGFDPGNDHIFYCHSGVRAATPLLALYLMGYPIERLRLYDGSWIDWSRQRLRNR